MVIVGHTRCWHSSSSSALQQLLGHGKTQTVQMSYINSRITPAVYTMHFICIN